MLSRCGKLESVAPRTLADGLLIRAGWAGGIQRMGEATEFRHFINSRVIAGERIHSLKQPHWPIITVAFEEGRTSTCHPNMFKPRLSAVAAMPLHQMTGNVICLVSTPLECVQ